MEMETTGTYLVLDDPLPYSRLLSTLGLLVLEPERPLDLRFPTTPEDRPDDPFLKLTQVYTLEPVNRKDVHLLLNEETDANLKTSLEKVFSIAASRAKQTELELSTAKISTYRLRDHNIVFQFLIDHFATDMAKFINDNACGRKLYMIVGLKTIVDERIRVFNRSEAKTEGKIKLPVSGIVQEAASVPVLMTDVGDPTLEASMSKARKVLFEAMGDGESIFAIQYRRIKRRPFLKRILAYIQLFRDRTLGLRLEDVVPWDGGKAFGIGGENEFESSDSDVEDNSDDDEFEVGWKNLNVRGLPQQERGMYDVKKDEDGDRFIFKTNVAST